MSCLELPKIVSAPHRSLNMKPTNVVDEMFPDGPGSYMDFEEGGSGGASGALLMDLAANEKAVHADFFNDFEDLCDDEDVE